MHKKHISIITPCFNEEKNVAELYRQVKTVFQNQDLFSYEHIFIDNASKDQTVAELKKLAHQDPNVKIIVNNRNFGVIRSGYYAFTQAYGDAVIPIVADLQDPPQLIPQLIEQWQKGYKIVKAIKSSSKESSVMYALRSVYYRLIRSLSDVEMDSHFTGFGLYDKEVIDQMRKIEDPYPYLRGLISELGYECAKIEYKQDTRKGGRSSYNFYSLYDTAMLGITSHSRVPLRLATFAGLLMSLLSFLIGLGYLIAKLALWDRFPLGTAPMIISIYFLASVQLFFIGVLGEYIGLLHMRSLKRPLVVEKERVNF